MTFPVGYHSLHPDVSMNFQMNRWYSCVGEPEMLEEMRTVAPRISTYADWKREFVALAKSAAETGHLLRSGFYWRSAEFFMRIDALEESGLAMTAEWHKPVSAVLDHFAVEQTALIGLSLGGCLVMRAAAFEPRVNRVIAYDVLTSFQGVNLGQTRPGIRGILQTLLWLRAAMIVNWLVGSVARTNPVVEWGLQQGMHVTGANSNFEYLQAVTQFETADVSASISQDVLLLAGIEDHYVPVEQWHDQIRMISNARSITARLFTRSEHAQNHCQVGNFGLALRTIVNWLDELSGGKAA